MVIGMRLSGVLLVALAASSGAYSRGTFSDETPQASVGAATPATPPGDRSGRPYLLEQVDDAAVV